MQGGWRKPGWRRGVSNKNFYQITGMLNKQAYKICLSVKTELRLRFLNLCPYKKLRPKIPLL